MEGGKSLSKIAYGTINPMRFVQDAPGIINGALQATGSSVPIIGIAAEWVDNMMGTRWQTTFVPQGYPAAASGEPLRLYNQSDMDTMIIVGSGQTVLPGMLLYSDASGNAVPVLGSTSSGLYWIGARAIEGGLAGDPIRCECVLFPYTKP